jgi:hypothetical protein
MSSLSSEFLLDKQRKGFARMRPLTVTIQSKVTVRELLLRMVQLEIDLQLRLPHSPTGTCFRARRAELAKARTASAGTKDKRGESFAVPSVSTCGTCQDFVDFWQLGEESGLTEDVSTRVRFKNTVLYPHDNRFSLPPTTRIKHNLVTTEGSPERAINPKLFPQASR